MKTNRVVLGGVIVAIGVTLGLFQNCAKQMDESALSSSSRASIVEDLKLVLAQTSLLKGEALALAAEGGTPPYVFSITGPGTLSGGNILTAGTTTGAIEVKVTDGSGLFAVSSVTVTAPTAGLPCPSPFDSTQTIADGDQVVAYKASSVACAATCEKQTRVCSNGVLSGDNAYSKKSCANTCTYTWVNIKSAQDYKQTHAQVCATADALPATDQGYGICASAENTPTKGGNVSKISYNGHYYSKAVKNGGTLIVKNSIGRYLCYAATQKQDGDTTDLGEAYLCKK